MHSLFEGEAIRVVATDSGLGGLAVTADLVERLKMNGLFCRAHVAFFNCRPAETFGFDTMTTPERRYRVFSNALDAMVREFTPDVILIACNTLSVLFDQTAFARVAHGPVIGLMEIGVDLMVSHLQNHPGDYILMFAAPTTVQSGIHRKRLAKRGYSAEQAIYQDCGALPNLIESGAQEARALIDRSVAEAVAKASDRCKPRVAALLCTHFGFALPLFKAAFRAHGVAVEPVLDPTMQMASVVLAGAPVGRFDRTDVTVEVVSQTIIAPQAQACIGSILESRSPQTAEALRHYACRPGLFTTD
ncbi:MAG: aspartate/glutamate racemase family protein [Kiritimatiellae bacterium]|nr:aspartate/glutamate racemase family protein [Kiritimatiellia bacterium]